MRCTDAQCSRRCHYVPCYSFVNQERACSIFWVAAPKGQHIEVILWLPRMSHQLLLDKIHDRNNNSDWRRFQTRRLSYVGSGSSIVELVATDMSTMVRLRQVECDAEKQGRSKQPKCSMRPQARLHSLNSCRWCGWLLLKTRWAMKNSSIHSSFITYMRHFASERASPALIQIW